MIMLKNMCSRPSTANGHLHQNCLGRASTHFVDGVDIQRTHLVTIAFSDYRRERLHAMMRGVVLRVHYRHPLAAVWPAADNGRMARWAGV